MATLLVTGGCGFIGSHLADALLADGHRVRVLDDLSSGHRENLDPAADLILGDVADPAAVARAAEGVDGVFHLAAIASVERARTAWLATHRANLSGTVAVFEAAARRRVPVVYASSAAVYGEPFALPIREDAPTRPLSAYGADKLGCELHARVAGGVHGVPTTGLRFFNVFGARQDPASPYSGVISIFLDRIARGEPVTIFGDGGQTRDFVHVSDVVAALRAALPRAAVGAPVLNVCTGVATSGRDLASAVGVTLGRPVSVRAGAPRGGEIRHSLGDPSAARAALGLGAPLPLARGLSRTAGFASENKARAWAG